MIKTFVKKPVEVQAVQWTGDNLRELSDFMGGGSFTIGVLLSSLTLIRKQ